MSEAISISTALFLARYATKTCNILIVN